MSISGDSLPCTTLAQRKVGLVGSFKNDFSVRECHIHINRPCRTLLGTEGKSAQREGGDLNGNQLHVNFKRLISRGETDKEQEAKGCREGLGVTYSASAIASASSWDTRVSGAAVSAVAE